MKQKRQPQPRRRKTKWIAPAASAVLEPIETSLLAAFMAGSLGSGHRRRITQYLAGHEDARELFTMAVKAWEASEK